MIRLNDVTIATPAHMHRHYLSGKTLRHFVWFGMTSGRLYCFHKNQSEFDLQQIFPESFVSSSVRRKTLGTRLPRCLSTRQNVRRRKRYSALSAGNRRVGALCMRTSAATFIKSSHTEHARTKCPSAHIIEIATLMNVQSMMSF